MALLRSLKQSLYLKHARYFMGGILHILTFRILVHLFKGLARPSIGAELQTTADQALLFNATDCEWWEGGWGVDVGFQ